MTALGTTGTQHFYERDTRAQEVALAALDEYGPFDRYVSGGCEGWDRAFGVHMYFAHPDAEHRIYAPANWAKVDPWWTYVPLIGSIDVYQMPPGTDYRARNVQIVENSDELFFCADFPEKHTKSTRSGTWMTVRIAERKPIFKIEGVILSEVPLES